MSFRIVEALDRVVEVEQVETGHRMLFSVRDDRTDLSRGSFQEGRNGEKQTKECWRGGYLHARRAALAAGWLTDDLTCA